VRTAIGALRERLVVQDDTPPDQALASLTATGTTATATCASAHGFVTGDYVTIAGATPTGFNGKVRVTVTSTLAFTYPVEAGLSSPASGHVTATYTSDATGGRPSVWRDTTLTLWAELIPLRASERMQLQTIASEVSVRFRTRARADLSETMRVTWTPTWPPGAAAQTLQVVGLLPVDDGREWVWLDCAELR